MVGSAGVGAGIEVSESTEINGEIESLPEDLVPVVMAENNEVTNVVQKILPYAVTEPEADDEITGEREAYMASILEKYKRSLVERTKHQLGTTAKGAIDDLDRVIKILKTTGYGEDRFYIHCDGALIGLMMPFVKRAPRISFEKPIESVCISGHKFLGCSMPCGVHITRLDHIKALSRNIEYIGCQDSTLMGSRSGHAPIFLWYALNQKGYRGLQKEVQMCLKNAQYLKERLRASGISAMLNQFSNIVVFEKPRNEEFIRYWQLAVQGNLAHVVVMPNITIAQLDEFLRDLAQKRATAIWLREGKHQPLCASANLGKENCACPRHK